MDLMIELSPEIYNKLKEKATKLGLTPQELAQELVINKLGENKVAENLIGKPFKGMPASMLLGIGASDDKLPPNDHEVKEIITEHLTEKYLR